MMGDWGGMHWGTGFGWVFAILFWALIFVGIAALAKWMFFGGGWRGSTRRPLDILKERYARGEITREQYEQMRRDIES
jgi:putative membrane protein